MTGLRLFLAIPLPEALRLHLLSLQQELPSERIKLVEPENLHITLKFLGSTPITKLNEIETALRSVCSAPFSIALKGTGAFPNENHIRVVWVGAESEGLQSLAQKINDALVPLFPTEKFSAHLTIARVKLFGKKSHQKPDLHAFLEKYRNETLGAFEVRSFHMMQSERGPSGPRYKLLAVFHATG